MSEVRVERFEMGGRRFDVESDLIFKIKKPIGLKANTDRQGKGPIKVETIQPSKSLFATDFTNYHRFISPFDSLFYEKRHNRLD